MVGLGGLVIALFVVGGAVIGIVMLPQAIRRKVLTGLGLLVLLLVAWDIFNYHLIHARQRAIRSEFTPGLSVSQATSWLEQNKKRLHISDWRYEGKGDPTFFIFLDAPFSMIALVREYEGAWYLMAPVDPETKTLKELK